MPEDTLSEPNLVFAVAIGYLIPFAGFYLGILIRHSLRATVFQDDLLALGQLCMVGMLFSLLAVAPLLPAFAVAISSGETPNYLLTLAVVIEAGFFMPESLMRAMSRNRERLPPAEQTV